MLCYSTLLERNIQNSITMLKVTSAINELQIEAKTSST